MNQICGSCRENPEDKVSYSIKQQQKLKIPLPSSLRELLVPPPLGRRACAATSATFPFPQYCQVLLAVGVQGAGGNSLRRGLVECLGEVEAGEGNKDSCFLLRVEERAHSCVCGSSVRNHGCFLAYT